MLKAMREHIATRNAAALREHAAFSTLANGLELDHLLFGLGPRAEDQIVRMSVPEEVLGFSLRDTDFRRRYGAYVIAIETQGGELHAPPDPLRTLGRDEILLVMQLRTALSQPGRL